MADTDAAAFCAAEFPRLVRGLSVYVGDVHVAEDLAQEALLRACRRWPHVSGMDAPGGWCWRVAVNLANSRFRRARVARRVQPRLDTSADGTRVDADGGVAVDVRRAVAALPDRQGQAVVLRFVLDLSVEQTAARMGVSSDAVRSLTKRATATLRDGLALDDDGGHADGEERSHV